MTPSVSDIAVLTGDLVASADLSDRDLDLAFTSLQEATKRIEGWLQSDLLFTRHRGDGWQVVVQPARYDLRVALNLIASLKALGPGFDTRVALARGSGTIPNQDLNHAHGPAFNNSGTTLDTLSGFVMPLHILHASTGSLRAVGLLLDAISQGWTAAQARAVAPMLVPETGAIEPPTHAEVAKRLGISRQAVSKALAAAKFDAVSGALFEIERDPS